MSTDEKQSLVPPELMEILRCPRCRGRLSPIASDLTCGACRLAYAVNDGVPNFLLEDARPLDEAASGGRR